MSVESVLFDRLSGDAGVAALVSGGGEDRIYPGQLPKNTVLPAIRYQRIGTTRPSAMGSDVGLIKASFQLDVWADNYAQMLFVRDAVRAALQRWRDAASGPAIEETFIDDERDFGFEQDLKAWRGGIDITIWARE